VAGLVNAASKQDRACALAPSGIPLAAKKTSRTFESGARMKIIGWVVLVIFLIGLAVVLGLGGLIF
jgi:hypothetical protein